MKYSDFLEKYSQNHGLKLRKIDENTYKLNSKSGLLNVYFRDHENYLECWGCFLDFSASVSEIELENRLTSTFNSKKMLFGLDKNYKVISTKEVEIGDFVEPHDFKNEICKFMESGFFGQAKFYKLENGAVLETDNIQISNPIEKLALILTKRKIPFEIKTNYLSELECFDNLIIDQGKTYLRVSTNFCGNTLKIEKESIELEFSVYKSKNIDLNKQKLEDIDLTLR